MIFPAGLPFNLFVKGVPAYSHLLQRPIRLTVIVTAAVHRGFGRQPRKQAF